MMGIPIRGHTDGVKVMALSKDNKMLATGGLDTII